MKRPTVACALEHRARASHLCRAESHGFLPLCPHHAGLHAVRAGHVVVTLGGGDRLRRIPRRKRAR